MERLPLPAMSPDKKIHVHGFNTSVSGKLCIVFHGERPTTFIYDDAPERIKR
jgi:hypothetical protein